MTLCKRGLSLTAVDAKANIATKPPSPLLSARKIKDTYFSEMMTVSVQKKMDKMPYTLSGVKGTWPEPNTSFMAYSTLVPMSPYTTPTAPTDRASNEDLLDCIKWSDYQEAAPATKRKGVWVKEVMCVALPDTT